MTAIAQENWTPVAVLSNLDLECAMDGGGVAIAPASDPRIVGLRTIHQRFDEFLDRFADPFGEECRPATLIAEANVLRSGMLTVEATSGFRDLAVAAVVPFSNTKTLLSQTARHRYAFSDYFSLYPWMVDRNFEDLVGRTPAAAGLHEVERFQGQTDPGLFVQELSRSEVDWPIFNALSLRWRREFVDRANEPRDRALFRSLNMANNAMRMWGGTDATFYDVGRSIALFVSAFEILAHDGTNTGPERVIELLNAVHWLRRTSTTALHPSPLGRIGGPLTLPSALYLQLYVARNHFLHGNAVTAANLQSTGGRSLWQVACLLYRMALAGELALRSPPSPAAASAHDLAVSIDSLMDFQRPQQEIERALATAL